MALEDELVNGGTGGGGTGDDGAGSGGGSDDGNVAVDDEIIDDGTGTGTGTGDQGDDQGTDGQDDDVDADLDLDGQDDDQNQGRDRRDRQREQQRRPDPDAKDTEHLRGLASARLRGLIKNAPEISRALKAHPDVHQTLEGMIRRETAYRELFPTVAEAREIRETFPNGVNDVKDLLAEQAEFDELDNNFYNKDRDGNYSGHTKIIDSMWSQNRDATVALFKSMPKEWHRLDPNSYNEVMSKVVGATFANRNIPGLLSDLIADAGEVEGNESVVKTLTNLKNWVLGFTTERQKTQADEDLDRRRSEMDRTEADRRKGDAQRFHNTFVNESIRMQKSIILQHPKIKQLMAVKTIPEAKRNEIVDKVRTYVKEMLTKSVPFMKRLNPAYNSMNLDDAVKVQKAAWSQQWLINRAVRSVMLTEAPQMVDTGRAAAARKMTRNNQQRRDSGQGNGNNNRSSGSRDGRRTGPYKEGGQWFRANGQRFTSAEVLAGKHQQP